MTRVNCTQAYHPSGVFSSSSCPCSKYIETWSTLLPRGKISIRLCSHQWTPLRAWGSSGTVVTIPRMPAAFEFRPSLPVTQTSVIVDIPSEDLLVRDLEIGYWWLYP